VAHAPARSPSAVTAPSEAPLPVAFITWMPTLEITSGRREGYVTGSAGAGTPGAGTRSCPPLSIPATARNVQLRRPHARGRRGLAAAAIRESRALPGCDGPDVAALAAITGETAITLETAPTAFVEAAGVKFAYRRFTYLATMASSSRGLATSALVTGPKCPTPGTLVTNGRRRAQIQRRGEPSRRGRRPS
jgi:hypothetical protein